MATATPPSGSPALEAAAIANHWKVLVVTKAACAPADIWSRIDATRPYPECPQWHANVLPRLLAGDADLVIMGEYSKRYDNRPGGAHIGADEWRDALARPATPADRRRQEGAVPRRQPDPAAATRRMPRVEPPQRHHLSRQAFECGRLGENALEEALAGSIGANFYDTSDWLCTGNVCPSVIGNMAVYLDGDHINNTYSSSLAPYFALLVKSILGLPS